MEVLRGACKLCWVYFQKIMKRYFQGKVQRAEGWLGSSSPYLGPNLSQITPMKTRAKTVLAVVTTPAQGRS